MTRYVIRYAETVHYQATVEADDLDSAIKAIEADTSEIDLYEIDSSAPHSFEVQESS